MTKRITDLKKDSSNSSIDLRGKYANREKEAEKLKKKKNTFYKKESPIKEVKDLSGGKQENYIYIKGTQHKPPKYLGNLIRVGMMGFFILLVINTINVYFIGKTIEADISATAYEGYNYLIDAGKSATKIQFDTALVAFDKAIDNFSQAEEDLWFINLDQSFYAEDNNIGVAVTALLESGKNFAEAGKFFLDAIEEFNKIPIYFVSKNDSTSTLTPSLTDTLKDGLGKTDLAINEISQAAEKIEKIDENRLPSEVGSRVAFAKEKIEEVSATLNATQKHFPALLKLLGDRYPHRYLILFQNNNEMRPTGGFIGSYAIMDVNDGYIESLETHDVYDIDGTYGGIIEPPEEFKAFTSNWRFRDSNYSPDFSVSAKKARWFLEKEGGPSVDTVIAINQGLLEDMLDITGPIQVGNFGKLNSDNYELLLSFVIEGKVWGAEDPKHILKVFVPLFKEAILKEENIGKVSSKLYKAIQQKHIMMYSADEDIQALFETLGISGKVHETQKNEDYLSVINISTGGTKSDQFIEEKINHDTKIDKYGKVIDEVGISRTHMWTDETYMEWKKVINAYGFTYIPDQVIDILGRGRNRVNTRIYVPQGSVLLDSNGADVMTKYDKDLRKTYFLVTMEVKAGETDEVWIQYRPPITMSFSPSSTYKLIIEKQPGSVGSIFTKTVTTDPEIENVAVYPTEAKVNETTATYATNLVYDRYFSGVWSKK